MNYEEPTQRIHVPRAAPAPMPGPLDLTGEGEPDSTEVLPLDELLGPPLDPEPEPAPVTAADDHPTWTAMPVVPVRSEPVSAPAGAGVVPASGASATAPGGALSDRLLTDARTAWDATLRRSRAWIGVQDNAIMLATATVAIVLIIVVALLGQ